MLSDQWHRAWGVGQDGQSLNQRATDALRQAARAFPFVIAAKGKNLNQ
jgi:hypothetical protein